MAKPTKSVGEISGDSLYTMDELQLRLGLGRAALRAARREGLIVKRIGRRAYCYGRDVITWFEQSARRV
jgi:hypothetical protein